MKTTRTKILFALIFFSATIPSMIFSAEEFPASEEDVFTTNKLSSEEFDKLASTIFTDDRAKGQKTITKLLKNDLDPNTADQSGRALLEHAVMGNNPTIVQALIEARADVDHRDDRGFTALHWAAYANYFDCRKIVKLLLKNGANQHIKANNVFVRIVFIKDLYLR